MFVVYSCQSGFDPIEIEKSPRDFTWTADTIGPEKSFQTNMYSIWGSSPDNVYMCGHFSRAGADIVGDPVMWHYDGTSWNCADFDYHLRPDLSCVHGSSPTNVWAVGYSDGWNPEDGHYDYSSIIKFDGQNWVEQGELTRSRVYSVYAESVNNVWACGADGIVYHFNGAVWDLDTLNVPEIPENFRTDDAAYQLTDIIAFNGNAYTMGLQYTLKGTQYYFFEKLRSSNWVLKDSCFMSFTDIITKWGSFALQKGPNGKLWSVGFNGVFEWNGSSWNTILNSENLSLTKITNHSSNNLISIAGGGHAYHYNGSDWAELNLKKYSDLMFWDVIQFKNEVFIIGITRYVYPQKTVVIHGK